MQPGILYKLTSFSFCKTQISVFPSNFALTFFIRCDMLVMLGRLWENGLCFAEKTHLFPLFVNFHMETF